MPWFQVEGEALTEEQIRGAVTRLLEEARAEDQAGSEAGFAAAAGSDAGAQRGREDHRDAV